MTTLETVLLVLLVGDALALAGLVLIQQGKGADVGAAFGAGSSNTMFGGGGSASFLVKATSWLAVGFFVISFGLAYTAKERAGVNGTEGIPEQALGVPAVIEDALVEEPLTPTDEAVDSDIPDV